MKPLTQLVFAVFLLAIGCAQHASDEVSAPRNLRAGSDQRASLRSRITEFMKMRLRIMKGEKITSLYVEEGKKKYPVPPKGQPILRKTDIRFIHKSENTTAYYCGPSTRIENRKPPVYPPGPPLNDKRMKLVSTLHNFSMYIDPLDNTVSLWIDSNGTREAEFISVIGTIVREGDNVINLGSQTGLQALVMGKVIGPTGHLYIFEPYDVSHRIVSKNVEINGMSDYTTIYKYGASDKKSEAVIEVYFGNTGGSQVKETKTPGGKFDEVQVIQIDKVDSLLPPDVKLDFALLDVEKMEVPALTGMMEVIRRSTNLILMVEWQYAGNPRRNLEQTLKLLEFLKQQGYKAYEVRDFDMYGCGDAKFYVYDSFEELLKIQFRDVFFIPQNHHLLAK